MTVMDIPEKLYYETTVPGSRFINIGSGEVITIGSLAGMIANIVGFKGDIVFNTNMPDGPPEKSCDSSRLNSLGWEPSLDLKKGLELTYEHALNNKQLSE